MGRLNAILGAARVARCLLPHLNLQGRDERAEEVELAQWADVFAECGAAEDRVDGEGDAEVSQRHPGGPPGRGPQAEVLVAEEEGDNQPDGEPLVAQDLRRRPTFAAQPLPQPDAGLPRQHERACHAKQVARHQQRQHNQPAVVQPRADCRQVLRRKLRPDEPVEDHQAGQQEDRNLHGRAGVAPLEERADDRPGEQVKAGERASVVMRMMITTKGEGCKQAIGSSGAIVATEITESTEGSMDVRIAFWSRGFSRWRSMPGATG